MRVLVFGKSGQVATELGEFDGVECLSRGQANLTNPQACATRIADTTADVVINAAAYTAVDKAEEEEAQANLINGETVGAMAKAAAARGLPFLHISTDYVFDGAGEAAWRPGDAVGPIGAYGRSKLRGERAVTAVGGTFAILRTSWVFSAHGSNFLKTMLRLAESRADLDVVNDQIGGPTAARDIAGALMTMARAFHDGAGRSGVFHFSGAPDCSWADFASEIFAQSSKAVSVSGIPTREYPTLAARPANSRMNCDSIRSVFGIERPNWRKSLTKDLEDLGAI
ncbi:MAG: dTDP-4-dehydrorhamnose reductase [Pseudomonadota bacterium]